MNVRRNNGTPVDSLEELGIPGQNSLRDALTSCEDPLKAIEEFQVIVELIIIMEFSTNYSVELRGANDE